MLSTYIEYDRFEAASLCYVVTVPNPPRLSTFPDRQKPAEFWTSIGDVEHEMLDFKVIPTPTLSNTIAAMAMTDGGLIVLGVSDDRQIVGCKLEQSVLDTVERAAHACGVDIQMRELAVGRERLTLVAVPEVSGRIVTTSDGRLLRRSGSENQPLLGDGLARFVAERTVRPAEEDAIPVIDADDFDIDLVNRALDGLSRTTVSPPDLMRGLIELGVAVPTSAATDPKVLNAAALLFCRKPRKYVPAAGVQLVRRAGVGPGPGPTRARREAEGPLPLILDEVLAFIEQHTSSHEVLTRRRRETVSEYPVPVVREAILNALAHRDYGLAGATVDVTVWDDRIEIHSPGSLPGHITLDNIRNEHYSRNHRVMHVLKALKLVEEYGEGVDRMYREMEARLMDPPTFLATPSSLTVTLRSRSLLGVEDQAWLALLGHFDLSAHERRVLVLAKREGRVTRRLVRAAVPELDPQALLAGMVTKGLLVMRGERGGAEYVLSAEVVLRAGAAGLEARSRQRQLLLDEMLRRGSISTTEALTILGEHNIVLARHLLNDLCRAGLARARGATRARRYYPSN